MRSGNPPLISIIIPAYNTSEYIHRAIGSSLRQTHKNVEVIVVDDGSTDNTLKVAQYFAGTDSRIRVLTQKNAGLSAARNYAIREARGEYMLFLDSDDWLEDDALEILLNAQKENPDCLICANQYYNVNVRDGKLFRYEGTWNMTPSGVFNMKEIAETFCFLRVPNIFRSACAKLFHAPFSARFSEKLKYAEDATFVIEYLIQSSGKAYYLSKSLLDVLNREGSAVRKKYTHEVFDSIEISSKNIIDLVKDEELKKLMRMSGAYYTYFCFEAALTSNESRSEIKRIKSFLRLGVWDIIKCKKYPFETRMRFFLAAFAPVSVYKVLTSRIFDSRESQQGGNVPEEDMIPGWQDFPKAQGI